MKSGRISTIGWLLAAISFTITALLPMDGISRELQMFFAATVCVIVIMAFELLPVLVSAIVLPALYTILGVVPAGTAFASWTNDTVWMILGGLVLSTSLDECGLLKRIAYYVICKCGGTYRGTVFGCFLVGVILDVITFCNGWIVTCAITFGVCKAMNLKPGRESALICFAGLAGANGSVVMLFHPGYVSMMESALAELMHGYTMDFFTPFIYNWSFALICCLSFFILLKLYGLWHSETDRTVFRERYHSLGAMTAREKRAAVYAAVLMLYLCTTQFTHLPTSYGFMLIPYLMFFPGIGVNDGSAIKKMNLSMVFFVATCLGIGTVGSAVGFGDFLADAALPLMGGRSKLFICLALMVFGTLSNLVMTPLAMLGALSLPFAQTAMEFGVNPIGACMILLLSTDMIFFPYESSGSLIMYSYNMMPMREFIKQNALKTVLTFAIFIVLIYPLWSLMGII